MKRQCFNGEAHHIFRDMGLRYGTRYEGMRSYSRIPGAHPFQVGMSIYLNLLKHRGLHRGLTAVLHGLGQNSPVRRTKSMIGIVEAPAASIEAMPNLPPECKRAAQRATQDQMFEVRKQRGRTTIRLPLSDATLVLMRGNY